MNSKIILALLIAFGIGYFLNETSSKSNYSEGLMAQTVIKNQQDKEEQMKLGAFSISLSVKDINVSKQFYENLGFTVLGGALEQNYLIMKNENALIGLFQGMFDGNILTFNPGWDENGKDIDSFDDIRKIQQHLKTNGIKLTSEADENSTGPASLMTTDPNLNIILADQNG